MKHLINTLKNLILAIVLVAFIGLMPINSAAFAGDESSFDVGNDFSEYEFIAAEKTLFEGNGIDFAKTSVALTTTVAETASEQLASYKETSFFGVSGFEKPSNISDGNRSTFTKAGTDKLEKGRIYMKNPAGIYGLYIEFDQLPKEWILIDAETGVKMTCGKNGYLHEYIDVYGDLERAPKYLILEFPKDTVIADIYGFSKGKLPEFVQCWETPCEKADLLLFSSHSDDEQLFFAGVLPYYAVEKRLKVQVAYIVQHFKVGNTYDHTRPHEQLDGLWTVGIRNYPVMADFPDVYSESKNPQTAFEQATAAFGRYGYSYDDFIEYIVTCIRQFKPLVVVSHDLRGEYGHGTHVLCARALTEAITLSGDSEKYPDSASMYGTWSPQKTYLHLYKENQITMNFDEPLESLGGKTAFEVTQQGFGCHKSQHWTWFNRWIYGTPEKPVTKASDIKAYSPCQYGLYDTKVGLDTIGNDFFENILPYGQDDIGSESGVADVGVNNAGQVGDGQKEDYQSGDGQRTDRQGDAEAGDKSDGVESMDGDGNIGNGSGDEGSSPLLLWMTLGTAILLWALVAIFKKSK